MRLKLGKIKRSCTLGINLETHSIMPSRKINGIPISLWDMYGIARHSRMVSRMCDERSFVKEDSGSRMWGYFC